MVSKQNEVAKALCRQINCNFLTLFKKTRDIKIPFKKGDIGADKVNASFILAGKNPPFTPGTAVRGVITSTPKIFVRLYAKKENKEGTFLLRRSVLKENPDVQKLKSIYSLPNFPNYCSEVEVPPTKLISGHAAAQPGWGCGGGIQWVTESLLPKKCFKEAIPIKEYLAKLEF